LRFVDTGVLGDSLDQVCFVHDSLLGELNLLASAYLVWRGYTMAQEGRQGVFCIEFWNVIASSWPVSSGYPASERK
jgi:hypothetical protein